MSDAELDLLCEATNHLLSDHDDCLDSEPTVAMIEEILERGSEKVDDEDVVQTLLTEVVDVGDARYEAEVSLGIAQKLR